MTADSASNILYVDDDEGLRRLTSRALERRGFVVKTASGGADCVALCSAEAFDLVAVDHYMPGMDGLETLAALRELPKPPPVIYVTGSDDSRLAVAALKAGAIDYVVKTVNDDFFDLLAQSINQALDTVRLRQAKDHAEQQLRETNERLQVMMQEVNHRVSNSLQIVQAFVSLQSRALDDDGARAALQDTQRRIAAIAGVHKHLYSSTDIQSVNIAEYLSSLVKELGETWSNDVAPRAISLSAQSIQVPTDKAVPIGIIVTELVTNACKYAYGAKSAGDIRVKLTSDGADAICLAVEDDGCGLPQTPAAKGTGIGAKLIQAMAASLKASVVYEDATPGVRAVLRIALS